MRKRDHEIKIRMTQRELEELDRKVAGTTLNRETFIREVLAERDIPLRLDADAFALAQGMGHAFAGGVQQPLERPPGYPHLLSGDILIQVFQITKAQGLQSIYA